MIHLSMLQLKDFWLDEFKVQSPLPSNQTEGKTEVSLNFGLNYKSEKDPQDPRIFHGILIVHIKPDGVENARKGPEIRLKLIGLFHIHPKAPESALSNYVDLSAPSILYGISRGIIATLMSISATGRMVVPSIDPRSFISDQEGENTKKRRKNAVKNKKIK